MSKFRFTPAMFLVTGTAEHSAEVANEMLDAYLSTLPVVFGTHAELSNGAYQWRMNQCEKGFYPPNTHSAYLWDLTELKPAMPCEHDPIFKEGFLYCSKCNKSIKPATWTVAE
jgi:hypothetical protein